MGFLLHPIFGRKIQWATVATKQTEGQSWEQLWIIVWVQNTASTSLHLCFHCLFPEVEGPLHKREPLLETPQTEEFSCGFRALYILYRHQPRCALFSTTHWRTLKRWQTLQFMLIHKCCLPFLVLLLLYYGQGQGRTETEQQFLSNQCFNLKYTYLHASNVSTLWLLATTLKFRLPGPLLHSPGRRYFGPGYPTVRLSNAIHCE